GVGCGYRSGCAMYTAQANCSTIPTCQWTTSTASSDAKPCESFGSEIACGQNALCQWNAAVKVCTTRARFATTAPRISALRIVDAPGRAPKASLLLSLLVVQLSSV